MLQISKIEIRGVMMNLNQGSENPNLMSCPDCCGKVSKRAPVCPHCGAVLNGVSASQPRMDQEEDIMICHPSVMHYLLTIIGGVLSIPLLGVGLIILLVVWIDIRFTVYRITNLRIVVTRGFIMKSQSEIWIKDMRGVNLFQGVWQRIIGVGNISIGTAATSGAEIKMDGIAKPQEIVEKINSLRFS